MESAGLRWLFQNDQLPYSAEAACSDAVEIHSACNLFTELVLTIPVRRSIPAYVETCRLVSRMKLLNQLTRRAANTDRNITPFLQLIRYPRYSSNAFYIIISPFEIYIKQKFVIYTSFSLTGDLLSTTCCQLVSEADQYSKRPSCTFYYDN